MVRRFFWSLGLLVLVLSSPVAASQEYPFSEEGLLQPNRYLYWQIEAKDMSVERRVLFAWFEGDYLWVAWDDRYFLADGSPELLDGRVVPDVNLYPQSVAEFMAPPRNLETAAARREALLFVKQNLTQTGHLMAQTRLRVVDETGLPIEGERLETLKARIALLARTQGPKATLEGALARPVSLKLSPEEKEPAAQPPSYRGLLWAAGVVTGFLVVGMIAARRKPA